MTDTMEQVTEDVLDAFKRNGWNAEIVKNDAGIECLIIDGRPPVAIRRWTRDDGYDDCELLPEEGVYGPACKLHAGP